MNNKISIICEIASAHEGSIVALKKMLDKAEDAGADWVKVQVFQYKELVAKDNNKFNVLRKIELNQNDWLEIIRYAGDLNPKLIVEVFDLPSLHLVSNEPAVKAYKIPTSDLGDKVFVDSVCQMGKPIFIGVGGATIDEIDTIVKQVSIFDNVELTLMHGIQNFPTQIKDSLLSRIQLLRQRYGCNVGFADHIDANESELSSVLPAMAVAAGATVIEKLITLNREKKGLDYYSALNPDEFLNFVEFIKEISMAIGVNGLANLTEAEIDYRNNMKKFAVLSSPVRQGEVLNEFKIVYRRTNKPGITRANIYKFNGRLFSADFLNGVVIDEQSFK